MSIVCWEHSECEERTRTPSSRPHEQAHSERIDPLREVRESSATLDPNDADPLRPAVAGMAALLRD